MTESQFKHMTLIDLLLMKQRVESCFDKRTDKEFLKSLKKEINERCKKEMGQTNERSE